MTSKQSQTGKSSTDLPDTGGLWHYHICLQPTKSTGKTIIKKCRRQNTLQPAFFSRWETFQELIPYKLLCKWPILCSDCAQPQDPILYKLYLLLFICFSICCACSHLHAQAMGSMWRWAALSFHHVHPDLRSSDSALTGWAILTSFLPW